jgi:hypothetical protein
LFIESRKELCSVSFDETAVEPTFLFPEAVLAELLELLLLDDPREAIRDFDLGLDAPPRTSKARVGLEISTEPNDEEKSPNGAT